MVATTKILAAAASATFLFSSAAIAENETHQLRMANVVAAGPLYVEGAQRFAEYVDFLSEGRIKIETFPGGTLGDPLKVSSIVESGTADMGFTWMAYDWGRDPATILFAGFAGSMAPEPFLHWLYYGGGVEMQREFRDEQFDVVSIPMFSIPTEVFLHSKVPVQILEDLKGLKFRTAGAWLEISESLGASPIIVSGAEIFPALERGVVDAIEWSTPSQNKPMGFHEITDYIIVPGVHQPTAPWELVVNKSVWSDLSERDQRLIETAAKLVTVNSWLETGNNDLAALEFYREQGKTVIELDENFQRAVKAAAVAWADRVAESNEWFSRVWESQKAYEKLWDTNSIYRKRQLPSVD